MITRWRLGVQLPQLGRSVPAWLTLGLLLVGAGISVPNFLLPDRLLALGQQVAPLAFVALGQTIVILIGGLDLSVGSVVTLSLVLVAGFTHGSADLALPGAILCLAVGAAIGTANGLLIERLRLPPLITTIAMLWVAKGIAWVYTKGTPGDSVPDALRVAADGKWGILPIADVIVVAAFAVTFLLLTRTVYGRRLYATGANRQAARLSGARPGLVTVLAYALCGMLAACGGLMLAGYVAVGNLAAGDPYVLLSLAVVILGGTTFVGGQGGVVGTLAGVVILAVLTALLIQLQVPIALRSILLAVIIVVAAVLQSRRGYR